MAEGTAMPVRSDVDAEEQLVGALMLDPGRFDEVRAQLAPDDLTHPQARLVYAAMDAIRNNPHGNSTINNVWALQRALKAQNRLNTAGGLAYLSHLTSVCVTPAHLGDNLALVAEHARARRAAALLKRATAATEDPNVRVGALATDVAAQLAALATADGRVRSVVDRARALGSRGKHLPTGFVRFDAATRGGPRPGEFIVVGGAPGTGKTTLVCNLADAYCRAKLPVAILAADESADGLLIRLGQRAGISREALEEGRATAELVDHVRDAYPKLVLVDAAEGHTIDSIAGMLVAFGPPGVLIVDSLQTAPALGTDGAESPRARADAVVAACKRAAAAGHVVFATCELARGAYRSRDASQRSEDISSFKESGAIEYGASVALVLRSVKGESDVVDVAVAKNRNGPRTDWRLTLDRGLALFLESDAPAENDADEREAALDRAADHKRELVRRKVLATVAANRTIKTAGRLAEAVGGQRQPVLRAIKSMLEDGSLTLRDTGFSGSATGADGTGIGNRCEDDDDDDDGNHDSSIDSMVPAGSGTAGNRAEPPDSSLGSAGSRPFRGTEPGNRNCPDLDASETGGAK